MAEAPGRRLVAALDRGFLPELTCVDDRPLADADVAPHRPVSLRALEDAAWLMGAASPDDLKNDLNGAWLPLLLLLCGENVQAWPWTTSRHIEAAYALLSLAKARLAPSSSLPALLLADDARLAGRCWLGLRAKLARPKNDDSWKRFPGARAAFVWLLHQVSEPLPDLTFVLPFTLTLTDDWQTENRLAGLRCLRHVIGRCTSRQELVTFGRFDLVDDVLKRLLGVREEDVVQSVFQTYFELFQKVGLSHDEAAADHGGKDDDRIDARDRLTKRLLENMELESDVSLRRCYVRQLNPLLRLLGPAKTTRWLHRLVRVLASILAMPDPEEEACRSDMLHCLMLVLDTLEAVAMRGHARDILEPLFRLEYELSATEVALAGAGDDGAVTGAAGAGDDGAGPRRRLRQLCVVALEKMAAVAEDEVSALCHGMIDLDVNDVFRRDVERVMGGGVGGVRSKSS